MFSNPVQSQRADKMPFKALWWLIAGLSFFCLLSALVNVVNGQVEKARHRDAQYNAAQTAIANCANNFGGVARSQCIDQVNASLGGYPAYATEPQTHTITQLGDQERIGQPNPASLATGGFMSASFAAQ